MNDTELINQIKSLKAIQPNQDWVFAVKEEILSKPTFIEFMSSMFLQVRPVLVTAMLLFVVLFGTLGFVENSLPGDMFYPMKKVAEDGQAVFLVSKNDIAEYKLSMANRRLEELVEIAEINQVKKLAPAISAFQANVAEAAENLEKVGDIKGLAMQSQELEKNREILAVLGIIVGETEAFDTAMSKLVEREIVALEEQSLSESQQDILISIKEYFEEGDYNKALEEILFLSFSDIN